MHPTVSACAAARRQLRAARVSRWILNILLVNGLAISLIAIALAATRAPNGWWPL
jgi:hypothetical protein